MNLKGFILLLNKNTRITAFRSQKFENLLSPNLSQCLNSVKLLAIFHFGIEIQRCRLSISDQNDKKASKLNVQFRVICLVFLTGLY